MHLNINIMCQNRYFELKWRSRDTQILKIVEFFHPQKIYSLLFQNLNKEFGEHTHEENK